MRPVATVEWSVALAVVTCAAVLLVAGLAKVASPRQAGEALRELGVPPRLAGPVPLRALAWCEAAVGVGLLPASTRPLAAAAAAVLGLGFAALGVAGKVLGSAAACGCIGRSSARPFGMVNVAYGAALAGVLPATRLVGLPAATRLDGLAVATALSVLLLSVWTNRRLVAMVLRRPRRPEVIGT